MEIGGFGGQDSIVFEWFSYFYFISIRGNKTNITNGSIWIYIILSDIVFLFATFLLWWTGILLFTLNFLNVKETIYWVVRKVISFFPDRGFNCMYVYVCIVLSNSTVYDHLKGLGLSSKLDVWVPHVLTERNLCRRIDVCDSLLKRHENDPFLKRIITGDEKWVVYNNVKRKRS